MPDSGQKFFFTSDAGHYYFFFWKNIRVKKFLLKKSKALLPPTENQMICALGKETFRRLKSELFFLENLFQYEGRGLRMPMELELSCPYIQHSWVCPLLILFREIFYLTSEEKPGCQTMMNRMDWLTRGLHQQYVVMKLNIEKYLLQPFCKNCFNTCFIETTLF